MGEWKEIIFGENFDILIGGTPSRSNPNYWDNQKNGENLWVSIRDLSKKHINETAEYISEEGAKHSNVKRISKGSVLMSFKLTIGKIAKAGKDLYTNEAIAALLPKNGFNNDFLFHGLHFWDLIQDVDTAIKGATLNKRKIEKIKVKIPVDLTEQTRIAQILSKADEAIAHTEALIVKYQRIKTGLMQDLLTRGINENGDIRSEETHDFKDSPLGRIPVEWEVSNLGDVSSISSGITLGKKYDGSDAVTLPYLRVANVQDGYLNLSEITHITIPKGQVERYLLKNGDVLMNEGGDFDKLGRGTIWRNEIKDCLHQNHVFKVRCDTEKILPEYLELISASPYGKQFFVLNSKQSTNLASINKTQLKSFPLPLPVIEEQKRILRALNSHNALLKLEKKKFAKLQSLKRGLMQDLLSGPHEGVKIE